MKRCLICAQTYTSTASACSACGAAPVMRDGLVAYAPEMADAGGGFKASYFDELALLEAGNFWFRARNRLILWALGRYGSGFQSYLEIGCGTGYVLSGVAAAYPDVRLSGSEIFSAGLAHAAKRLPAVEFMQMDARALPFVEEFDVIGAFDVLEHIEQDTQVLEQVSQALMPHGILLLTVPQHAWLWSPVDEYACHVRRYAAADLHAKIEGAGFEILRSTSFVSILLPAMLLSRFMQRKRTPTEFDPHAEFRISPRINTWLGKLLELEMAGIVRGINLPLGGSRLVVARKT